MSQIIDVTDQVRCGNNDDEHLPITRCLCGFQFTEWEFIISIYADHPTQCPNCKRRLFFKNTIRVFEVT